MTAYEASYREDAVPEPSQAEIAEHLEVRERMAMACGYRIPSNRVGFCVGCGKNVPLLNVRLWPDFGYDIGECCRCGSTLKALQEGAPTGA